MTKLTDDKFIIPISDFFRLCRNERKKIFAISAVIGMLGALFALFKPVEYLAESTFRERSPKPSNVGNSTITSMIIGNIAAPDNEAIATIKSRYLMSQVIKKLGLQATIDQTGYSDTYFGRLQDHISTDLSLALNDLTPSLPDFQSPLHMDEIVYNGEVPIPFKIVAKQDNYEVFDSKKNLLGEGKYGIPFIHSAFRFTLERTKEGELKTKPYDAVIWPMMLIADRLVQNVKVEQDPKDKNVLKLSYKDRNRQNACLIINGIMACYQDHLKESQDRQSTLQLAYLQHRQDESGLYLAELMHKHAQSLSEDLSSVGFADSEKEMEFLAKNQHELKERLLSKELEMKRLQNVLSGTCVYYDRYATDGDPYVINNILDQIRALNQQRDSLQLSLSKSSFLDPKQIQLSLAQQLNDLKEAQLYSQEINEAINAYKRDLEPDTDSKLYNDPRFLLKTWHDNLFVEVPNKGSKERDNWDVRKERFLFYLENLKRLFGVNEKIIQERLSHQHNPSLEFQGVNLKTADELYIGYSRQVNDIEGEIRRNRFLVEQVSAPHFEISSLSPSLSDSVSQGMITRASQLSLDLKDENNRSHKEQERLKQELELQRNFLSLHLTQMGLLMELNQKLLEEKIFSLQNITLELIHQQISLLEKNLSDYIASRLENLKEERSIIQHHIDEIHATMASLPQRWVSEKLIEQSVATNQLIVEEIAKMVEFKNINHKLELIQSAPIDHATAPLHALPSGILLRTFLGAFLGGIGAITWLFSKSLKNGIRASKANLQLRGLFVAGNLSQDPQHNGLAPIRDSDLNTLRRLQDYLSDSRGKLCDAVLLIEGRGPDYAPDLAELFIKKGLKVLRLDLTFNKAAINDKPGLLQYLSGELSAPYISKGTSGDSIDAGGFTRFSNELLKTDRFTELLKELNKSYDCVIAVSHALPGGGEAEGLLPLFSNVVVSIDRETLPELQPYFDAGMDEGKKLAFVMVCED